MRLPRYDFVTSSRRDDSMLISDADVILFDGILIFYWEELRDLFDLKVKEERRPAGISVCG